MSKKILGIGNAIVDVFVKVDDSFLQKNKLIKGSMKLIGKSEFEKQHHALFSLMCIYGIELLADNVMECREILLETFTNFLAIDSTNKFYSAGVSVLNVNIIQGDALTLTKTDGSPIEFPEWGYL